MRKTSLLVVALLIGGLAGCDSEDVTGNSDLLPLETDTFAVVDGEDAFSNVETATLDSEMAMNPVFSGGGHFARHRRHPHGPGSHLAPVLMRLDLDETQRLQIRELVGQHRSSIRAAMEGLREVNMELIRQANEERRAIKEAFHAGEITREEAEQQLRELSERTREAIRSNPDNDPYLQQICEARLDLFAGIRAILDESQVATWDEWVDGLDNDCINGQ